MLETFRDVILAFVLVSVLQTKVPVLICVAVIKFNTFIDDVVTLLKFPVIELRKFMLPLIELNWKQPILLAVIVPLDRKDVDMVLRVAYGEVTLKVLILDVMTEPNGPSPVS